MVSAPKMGAQLKQINIMKLFNRISRRVAGGFILAAVFAAVPAIIHADGTNSAAAAAAKPVPYPLKTCVVSGDKLGGDMGEPIVFVYTNKSINQEIKFCCPMCKPTFLAEPDKYMKIIKEAEAKAKAKGDKN